MRWNHRFIVCCSSLVLFGFAGCKKVIKINVDRSLAPPIATTAPGETLEWVATESGETFDVVFQAGLCTQTSPIRATYGHSALCTVATQTFGLSKQPILYYTYHLESPVDAGRVLRGPEYKVAIGPGHCPHC